MMGLDKTQAEARYYPVKVDFALTVTQERIEEWSYEEDPHGYCHERAQMQALVTEIERLRAIGKRAQGVISSGTSAGFADVVAQSTARMILGEVQRLP